MFDAHADSGGDVRFEKLKKLRFENFWTDAYVCNL